MYPPKVFPDLVLYGSLQCSLVAAIGCKQVHVSVTNRMIKGGDGVYRLDHAVTATQKEILRAFGLGEEFVKAQAAELSERLRKL